MSDSPQQQIQGKPSSNNFSFSDPAFPEMKRQSDTAKKREILAYCDICSDNVGHNKYKCPYREQAGGKACRLCRGPCQMEWKGEHGKDMNILQYMIKLCAICGCKAEHWALDCPYNSEKSEVEAHGSDDHSRRCSDGNDDDYFGF